MSGFWAWLRREVPTWDEHFGHPAAPAPASTYRMGKVVRIPSNATFVTVSGGGGSGSMSGGTGGNGSNTAHYVPTTSGADLNKVWRKIHAQNFSEPRLHG